MKKNIQWMRYAAVGVLMAVMAAAGGCGSSGSGESAQAQAAAQPGQIQGAVSEQDADASKEADEQGGSAQQEISEEQASAEDAGSGSEDTVSETEAGPVYATAEEAFAAVLDRYRDAIGDESFDEDQYRHMATSVLVSYHMYDGMDFYYAYYDIDSNGSDELIIGCCPVDYNNVLLLDLYAYNGTSAERLINNDTFGDRSSLMILSDGTIFELSSDGTEGENEYYYRLAEDGYTVETAESGSGHEVTDFEWNVLE